MFAILDKIEIAIAYQTILIKCFYSLVVFFYCIKSILLQPKNIYITVHCNHPVYSVCLQG